MHPLGVLGLILHRNMQTRIIGRIGTLVTVTPPGVTIIDLPTAGLTWVVGFCWAKDTPGHQKYLTVKRHFIMVSLNSP